MDAIAAGLPEIFASDAYMTQRIGQVKYLWDKLAGSVPVLRPASGHGVFIDLNEFFAPSGPEPFAAEALAAFVYQKSGIRISKGPPLAPSQVARGVELLRLAVPARKYLNGHMDDVANAVGYAFAQRNEIRGLQKIDDAARSKYDPAHFVTL
jgi:tryptophanase